MQSAFIHVNRAQAIAKLHNDMPHQPDFILFGAPKSGTTSLYHYLQQHPKVQMSALKEPHFFQFDGPNRPRMQGPHDAMRRREMIDDWNKYQALFSALPAQSIKGEASIRYLYSAQACAAMRQRVPEVKLIAILRHPVDRAYSAFVRDRMHGIEPLDDFAAAMRDGARREQAGWYIGTHAELGYYAKYLQPYLQAFPPEQIRIYLYDDLRADAAGLMRELFGFLGVDEAFEPDLTQRFNVTGTIQNPIWRFLWRSTRGIRSHVMPMVPMRLRGSFFNLAASLPVRKSEHSERLDPALRAEFTALFRDDILQLEQLLDRDLQHWLKPTP